MPDERRISEAEHEWRSCTRKIRYPNVEAARDTCAEIYRNSREVLHAYLCGFCGHYHIGHYSSRRSEGPARKRLEKARRRSLWKELADHAG